MQIYDVKRIGSAVSITVFPVMLLAGFLLHPNLLDLSPEKHLESWIGEWRGNFLFHFGHLLVLFAVPPVIVTCLYLLRVQTGRGAWFGFVGGVFGIFGAFMLAVDKGALTLVLTAFQQIPDPQFEGIKPALAALLARGGWLWITSAFALLPIGVIIQTIGLLREGKIERWQGGCIIVGLLLLMNPDIEIISSVGAALMCVGFIPMGLSLLASRSDA